MNVARRQPIGERSETVGFRPPGGGVGDRSPGDEPAPAIPLVRRGGWPVDHDFTLRRIGIWRIHSGRRARSALT